MGLYNPHRLTNGRLKTELSGLGSKGRSLNSFGQQSRDKLDEITAIKHTFIQYQKTINNSYRSTDSNLTAWLIKLTIIKEYVVHFCPATIRDRATTNSPGRLFHQTSTHSSLQLPNATEFCNTVLQLNTAIVYNKVEAMFCKKCGNKLEATAQFCSACGATTSSNDIKSDSFNSNTPIITARPVFIPWVAVASIVPIQLFATLWATGFLGGFGLFAIQALELNLPQWLPFAFFGVLAFFGIPIVLYYAKKKTYATTEYIFYRDRLEYAEGFWTTENKTIKYKNITETNLRKGVIQKQYGLGTIILSTPATGTQQGRAKSGVSVTDIENTEEIYKKVQKLMEENK